MEQESPSKVTGLHIDIFDSNLLLCTMLQLAPVSKITSVGMTASCLEVVAGRMMVDVVEFFNLNSNSLVGDTILVMAG